MIFRLNGGPLDGLEIGDLPFYETDPPVVGGVYLFPHEETAVFYRIESFATYPLPPWHGTTKSVFLLRFQRQTPLARVKNYE